MELNAPYHSVLAHKHNSISSQAGPNLVHLLGADIVNCDNENRLVFLQQPLELIEVAGLVGSLAPHVFFGMKIGFLRVKFETDVISALLGHLAR